MKFWHRTRIGYLATLGAGLAIGLTVVGSASASPQPTALTVHQYTVAASAFAPDSLRFSDNLDYFNAWNPSTLTNQDELRCFNAGVILPSGALVKSVTFYYTNGATDSFFGELNRQNLPAHLSRVLASVNSTPTGGTPVYTHTTVAVTNKAPVDTTKYAYSLGACPFGDATFSGATVNYTG
jgi:hypothetical protein